MATILHLETATRVCSVALSVDGKLIALKESDDEQFMHAEKLTVFIQEVMKEANLEMKDLSAISVSSGPGSYTGLRIGGATAKGICYALQIPLIAVDSLISLAALVEGKYNDRNICAVIDARRMEVYNLFTDKDLNPLKEITADIIEEETYNNFEPFVCVGDGSGKLSGVWDEKDCILDLSIKSSAKGQVKIAYQKFLNSEFEDVAYWEPFYLKDFIAGKKK